jgi:hypothetical protein
MNEPSIADRLDRIEASLALQQLPSRYALAVDSRDLDALISLYVEGIAVGAGWPVGREGLRQQMDSVLQTFYRTFHQILGQTFDFLDADHATGTVYCLAQHECGDHWVEVAICYFDHYERRDGRWLFGARRELRMVYFADMSEGPKPASYNAWPGRTDLPARQSLSHSFPSWKAFWDSKPAELVNRLSSRP